MHDEFFRPRKSLGQSFLVSQRIADALVAALEPTPQDTILEIGPGHGVLTERIVGRVARLVAVELDRILARRLAQKYGGAVEVVEADFLRFDFAALGTVKVIGNLPYNISSQIIFRLLEEGHNWSLAVLTTQREFAARVLASPGSKEYAALSVLCECVCIREKLFNIAPAYFRPRPRVVSTAFRLRRRKENLITVSDPEGFKQLVKACFSQRRKTLVNNLAHVLGLSKSEVLRVMTEARLPATARAEYLTLDDFARLYDCLRTRFRSSS